MVFTTIDTSLTPTASMGYQNVLNILDNAGFDIWQRGTSINLGGGGQYATDRWNYPGVTGGAVTVSKETTITHNSVNSLKFNITNAGSATIAYLFQNVENYLDYAGRTVSLSCWVNTTMSNVRVALQNGVVQSAAHPGDGQWHQLTVTTTLATNITFLNAFLPIIPTGLTTGIIYVDSAMLVVGSTPIEHVPTPPEVDLARCQRYFYATPAINNAWICHGHCQNATTASCVFRFPVPMRIGPTLTVNNPTNFSLWNASGSGIALTSLVNAGAAANTDSYSLEPHVASGLVAGNTTILLTSNANAQLFFSADF